ncbi:hypothetical protein [Bacillus sp. REN10]|nr:hypothetical protein [Bacillus sp. REN10]
MKQVKMGMAIGFEDEEQIRELALKPQFKFLYNPEVKCEAISGGGS